LILACALKWCDQHFFMSPTQSVRESHEVVYIGLGGNVGPLPETLARFRSALQLLADVPGVTLLHRSSVYRTRAWGNLDQPDFLNAAVSLRCEISPQQLLLALKSIEEQLGRIPRERWGQREIDLDILLYGNLRVQEPNLTIPHPHLLERAFVLVPLLEIAPGLELPDHRPLQKAAAETLRQTPDLEAIVGAELE
jgi:2-amino-4-hydroxy-6-hydroxymethyldihydropteridine diphosphokinase